MQHTTQRPVIESGTFTIGGDLTVYRLGYGTMRLTGPRIWGPPRDRQEALAVLRRALELGVSLLDTADSYGPEVAESLIAEALYPYPKDLVIATKGGLLRTGPNVWPRDGRPEHLRKALEGSLRRLRLERIDLYQLHFPDPRVPFEDSVGELAKLRQEGKIRHVGLANTPIDLLALAQQIVPIVTVQNHYNLGIRQSEYMSVTESEEMIDLCARQGIGFIAYQPLEVGELARSGGVLGQIARRHNAQPAQIALAWLLKRSPALMPIPGPARVEHLEEDMAAATIRLSQEEYDLLDQESR
jgi:pyridoxine 4-dehydrogenase